MTTDEYLTAWATASRDEAEAAWRALYDALHPAPVKPDCEYLHSASGPGCPYCWLPRPRTPLIAQPGQTARNAATTTSKEASTTS